MDPIQGRSHYATTGINQQTLEKLGVKDYDNKTKGISAKVFKEIETLNSKGELTSEDINAAKRLFR